MENKEKFFKKSLIYLGSSFLFQGINIFSIPIYTRNFSLAEFGEFTIVTSFQSLLSAFVTLGIFSGLARFFYETDDQNRLKNIVLTFSLIWGSVNLLVILSVSRLISPLIFGKNSDGPQLINLTAINVVLVCLINIYITFFTMEYKALKSSLVSIINLLIALLGTFYFVAVLKWGIGGALWAQLLAAVIVFGSFVSGDLKNIRFVLDKPNLKKMLSYSIGLFPGQVGIWFLMLFDRYIIKEMINLNAVGVYSMGYKIGMLVQPILMNPFKNVFTPYKFEIYKEKNSPVKLKRIFLIYNFVGWLVVLELALFAAPAIQILATRDYRQAYTIVPLVAFAYFIWSLGEFYGLGLHITNRTMLDSMIVIGGALLNIGFNIVLIPRMGIYGAATAAMLSYLAMTLSYFYLSRRYYQTGIRFWEPFQYAVAFIIIYLTYLYGKPGIDRLVTEILFSSGLSLLYILICYWFGLIPDDAIELFRNLLVRSKNCGYQIFRKTLVYFGIK